MFLTIGLSPDHFQTFQKPFVELLFDIDHRGWRETDGRQGRSKIRGRIRVG